MKLQIGIIGGETKNLDGENKEEILRIAEEIGRRVAEKGAVLVTGGCSGVAEAACLGAEKAGGVTVGTPGRERRTSVSNVTVEICTPIGIGEYLFSGILSCDSIIAPQGGVGTIAELAFAYRNKKPIIFIEKYEETFMMGLFRKLNKEYPLFITADAEEAVNTAFNISIEKFGQ